MHRCAFPLGFSFVAPPDHRAFDPARSKWSASPMRGTPRPLDEYVAARRDGSMAWSCFLPRKTFSISPTGNKKPSLPKYKLARLVGSSCNVDRLGGMAVVKTV